MPRKPTAPHTWPATTLGVAMVAVAMGCTSAAEAPGPERIEYSITSTATAYRVGNAGRIVGAVALTSEVQQALGSSDFTGAKAQAFDPDGTPLGSPVDLNPQGQFLLTGLKESRPRVFVEVIAKSLRFRATVQAPREKRDYPVLLDSGSTYLADKLRRAALDLQVPFDRLDGSLVDQTEEVVNTYMPEPDRTTVLTRLDPDLNAYAFDHFMEDTLAVRVAMHQLAPSLTRGWKPTPSLRPLPLPSLTATPRPSATPVASADPGSTTAPK